MNVLQHEPAVILIIDHDPITLTGIAAVLNMSGYECHCARDRVAATKAVNTLALDLIICDVSLAGESGLDLCQDLRQQPGLEDVPLMFISAAQAPDIVRKSHDAGGAYYLRKPFDPEVLIELVGRALWMPHLVQSRVQRMQSYPQIANPNEGQIHAIPAAHVPPSHASHGMSQRHSRLQEVLTGIRMPQA